MNLDTYRSTRVDGIFVTLRSNDRANLGVIEELARLGLDSVRHEYELSGGDEHSAFAQFVLTEIVLKGYATHDAEGVPVVAPRYVR